MSPTICTIPSELLKACVGVRSGDLSLAQKMQYVFEECTALAAKKNNDYSGGKKIDNIALTGTHGVGVRLMDKVCRVLSLHEVESLVKAESLRDTALDIVNYACFLVLLLDGKWGKTADASETGGGSDSEAEGKSKS
jgi:hypothetical protein